MPWLIITIVYIILNLSVAHKYMLTQTTTKVKSKRGFISRSFEFNRDPSQKHKTRTTAGLKVLTFSPTVLAFYGRFDDSAQLMDFLSKACRTHFRDNSTYFKSCLRLRPVHYEHLSEATKSWEKKVITLRLQGAIK